MYIHLTTMATKSITITNVAYEKLAMFKESKESFSDVINKLTSKYSLLNLIGILSKKDADELESNIKELRKNFRKRLDKTASELK